MPLGVAAEAKVKPKPNILFVITDDIGIDERKTAIVSAVVSVSHELGFSVVAEGVESEVQAARLSELGCDSGQGYLFGKPMPIGEGPWV